MVSLGVKVKCCAYLLLFVMQMELHRAAELCVHLSVRNCAQLSVTHHPV